MHDGWMVNFKDFDSTLENTLVHVPRERLVIGLANGWANDGKFVYIDPRLIRKAYNNGLLGNRGFAFWNIKDEGLEVEVDYNAAEEGVETEGEVHNAMTVAEDREQYHDDKRRKKEKLKCIMAREIHSIFHSN